MSDDIIRQTLPCPSCGHPITPDVGLKIPSLPEAVKPPRWRKVAPGVWRITLGLVTCEVSEFVTGRAEAKKYAGRTSWRFGDGGRLPLGRLVVALPALRRVA